MLRFMLASNVKVYRMISKHLNDGGLALVASKRYYFGVGGGTEALKELVERDESLDFEVVRIIDDGKSNIREIIKVFKSLSR